MSGRDASTILNEDWRYIVFVPKRDIHFYLHQSDPVKRVYAYVVRGEDEWVQGIDVTLYPIDDFRMMDIMFRTECA